MIHVVVMTFLIGLPLLIPVETLRRSRSRSFKNWGVVWVGVGSFVYRLHSPDYSTSQARPSSMLPASRVEKYEVWTNEWKKDAYGRTVTVHTSVYIVEEVHK
jgi:hypothetical protein